MLCRSPISLGRFGDDGNEGCELVMTEMQDAYWGDGNEGRFFGGTIIRAAFTDVDNKGSIWGMKQVLQIIQ